MYAEASAVLKLHVDEPESDHARAQLEGVHWASGRHTYVEVRRNLARLLAGSSLHEARAAFLVSWRDVEVIELAEAVVEHAAEFAERTGARALDALHLGAASAAGADDGLPIVTFDRRLADAARSLGWTVLGVQ